MPQPVRVHKHPVTSDPVAVHTAGRVGVPAVLMLNVSDLGIRRALREAYAGEFPIRITSEEKWLLLAMAAAVKHSGNSTLAHERVYRMLADASEKYGRFDLREG